MEKKNLWLNKKGQTGDWYSLLVGIAILLALVFILPTIIIGFDYPVPSSDISSAGVLILNTLVQFVFFVLGIVPLIIAFVLGFDTSFFGDTRDLLTTNINYLSYIPEYILTPLVIIMVIMLGYPIVSLIRGK